MAKTVKVIVSVALGIIVFLIVAAITVTILLGIDLWRRRHVSRATGSGAFGLLAQYGKRAQSSLGTRRFVCGDWICPKSSRGQSLRTPRQLAQVACHTLWSSRLGLALELRSEQLRAAG